MRNMAARAQSAGAQLEVESQPGQGTSISIHLPLVA
jgi:signal transduction histidine kinase